jgi:hypothetical protein
MWIKVVKAGMLTNAYCTQHQGAMDLGKKNMTINLKQDPQTYAVSFIQVSWCSPSLGHRTTVGEQQLLPAWGSQAQLSSAPGH